MPKYIKIRLGSQDKMFEVQQLATVKNMERWQLTAGNDVVILANNRLILKKHRLKNWEPKWTIEAGRLTYVSDAEKIGRMIEEYYIK